MIPSAPSVERKDPSRNPTDAELHLSRHFWTTHAALPALCFVLGLASIAAWHLDFRLAAALFYDAGDGKWIGAHTWWAEKLIHGGGRNLIRAIVVAALVTAIAASLVPRWRFLKRDAWYVVLSMAVATGVVGALKQLTNVDCPWDLTDFGGHHPFVGLFESRPPGLPHAACFPGAHSSSGFALLCFYFVLRDRKPRAARLALIAGVVVGIVFAFAQEARGAHFLSHDMTSAAIVWFLQLAGYVAILAPRAAERSPTQFLTAPSQCSSALPSTKRHMSNHVVV